MYLAGREIQEERERKRDIKISSQRGTKYQEYRLCGTFPVIMTLAFTLTLSENGSQRRLLRRAT